MMAVYKAGVSRRWALLSAAALLLVGIGWGFHHVLDIMYAIHGHGTRFGVAFTVTFILLGVQMTTCYAERPYTVTERQQRWLNRCTVLVPVPVYNEDPTALKLCLASLVETSLRRPNIIHVVDDGSKVDYSEIRDWFVQAAARHGIQAFWDRVPNGGKRSAQARAVLSHPDVDFVVTCDSDGIFAPDAIEEILKPFVDGKVNSVAGVVLPTNNSGPKTARYETDKKTGQTKRVGALRRAEQAFIARITDVWFVMGQMVDRSSMSAMKSVLVNSGPLAAYRASIIRANVGIYTNEWFFSRKVEFSDDSFLTLFSRIKGHTVQQPTAFVFTLMPERTSHHLRQFVRWMRGSFIRSFWRMKYLPMTSVAFWIHAVRWFQVVLSTIMFVLIVVTPAVRDPRMLAAVPTLLVVPMLVAYGQGLRYLIIRRSDQSLASQLLTYLMIPLASMWAYFVLRAVRWYGWATCLKTGWGTRQDVEVSMAPQPAESAVAA